MMGNKFLKLALYCQRFGFLDGLRIVFLMSITKKGKIIKVRVPGIAHPIYIRAQSSDEYIFQQIFVKKEYEFKYYGFPETIIDAGANIGLAAVYFANRYPGCSIICLEPEAENNVLLLKNIRFYTSIKSLECGLWSKSTYLKIGNKGLGNWGFVAEECSASETGAIRAVSLPDLIEKYQLKSLDIVKLDIEGSEKEVLESKDLHQWLSICKVLVIELHDRLKKGTSTAFFQALLYYDVEMDVIGENLICRIEKLSIR